MSLQALSRVAPKQKNRYPCYTTSHRQYCHWADWGKSLPSSLCPFFITPHSNDCPLRILVWPSTEGLNLPLLTISIPFLKSKWSLLLNIILFLFSMLLGLGDLFGGGGGSKQLRVLRDQPDFEVRDHSWWCLGYGSQDGKWVSHMQGKHLAC